jgi:outer membrane protein insertion porin family
VNSTYTAQLMQRSLSLILALMVGVMIAVPRDTAAQGPMPERPGEGDRSGSQQAVQPAPLAPQQRVDLPAGQMAREGAMIDRVQVQGNRRVESETILSEIRSRAGQPLVLETISDDIRRVYELGYFDDIRVDARQTTQGEVVVTFIVAEKPAIDEIVYVGNDEVSTDDIEEVVDLRRFAILNVSQVNANAEKIRDLYHEKGYFLAEVDYEIAPRPGRPDLAVVTFRIREYAKVQVKQITFLGNRNIASEDLRAIMATREGHWLSFLSQFGSFRERDFEIDLQRLTAYYYDQGFVQVAVSMPQIRLSRDKRFLYITVQIDEGDQHFTSSVDVTGDLLADRDDLRAMTSLAPGEVFSYGTMRRDMEALRTFYMDAGYAYVNVSPLTRVDPATKTVDVAYDIQQGNQVYIGRIEVVGNTKTRDRVIRRELRLEEGQLYSQTALDVSRARVGRLGYFEGVDITSQRGARDDVIDLRVEVRERATGTFQLGAGISSQENFIFNAQIAQNNLFGRGQSLGFNVQASSIRTLFNLQFTEPWLFDSRWQFAVDLYNFDFVYQDFSRRSTGGNMTFGYPLEALGWRWAENLRVSMTYKLEDVAVTPGGTAGRVTQPTSPLFEGGFTSSVAGSVVYDNRNDRMFPTQGAYHSARIEAADRTWTLSENQFVKYDAETRWYFPLFWEFVLRLNGSLGYVVSTDPNRPVPIFERYFAGGPTTVRGFERYTLGPVRRVPTTTDDQGALLREFHYGGNKRLLLTAEIEFPIFAAANVKGVVFADAGNAFDDGEALTLVPDLFRDDYLLYRDALRTSVGFGVRWFSPIGPLRFEWGIPLQRLPGEKPIHFDFSISQSF